MAVINRVLSQSFLESFKLDFKNLIRIVNDSHGELDLAIRDNYLNLYYKGNSLAQISPRSENQYKINIHQKFFSGTKADDPQFYLTKSESGSYMSILLDGEKTPLRFMQKAHIDQFCLRVKQVNYSEEITFEQMLMTDNMDREDLIIIDRQVVDKIARGKIDLLALKQIKARENRYQFLVMEVKMGNNPELMGAVAKQLKRYKAHICEYIEDYARCYEQQYVQKRELGILGANMPVSYTHLTLPTKRIV